MSDRRRPRRGSGSWLGKIAVVQPTQALIPPKIDPKVQQAVTDALLNDRRLCGISLAAEARGYVLNPLGLVQRGPVATSSRPLPVTMNRGVSSCTLSAREHAR